MNSVSGAQEKQSEMELEVTTWEKEEFIDEYKLGNNSTKCKRR